MKKMFKTLTSYLKDESGLETIEWAFILVVAVLLIGGVIAIATKMQGKMSDVGNYIDNELNIPGVGGGTPSGGGSDSFVNPVP